MSEQAKYYCKECGIQMSRANLPYKVCGNRICYTRYCNESQKYELENGKIFNTVDEAIEWRKNQIHNFKFPSLVIPSERKMISPTGNLYSY